MNENNQSSNSMDDQIPDSSVNNQNIGNDPDLTSNTQQELPHNNQQGFQQTNQQDFFSNGQDFSQNNQQDFSPNGQDFSQNNQQGFPPYNQQGFQPNDQQGFQPNDQQGFQPNGQQGFQPNGQQGFQPNDQQGFQPNGQQGFQPNGQQGFQQNFQNSIQDAWNNGQQGNTYQNGFPVNQPFQPNPQPNIKPKKKFPKWALASIIGGIVVILGVVGFFFYPQLSNTFALYTMSAEDYYAKVEKNNVEKTINSTTQYMEMMQTYLKEMAKDGVGYEYSIKGTIDPSVAESAGYSELSSLELKMDINSKSNLAKISYETFLNDTALISADILADIENSKAYMQVKELSDKYLSLPFDTAYEDSELSDFSDYYASIDYAQFQEALENFDLDKDTQKRILERYSNVIIDSIKDVSLDKGVKVSVEDTSSKQTKIECKIDTDDMKKMLANIIASAKTDKDIMKLLVDNGVCTENDYTSALAIAEAYISSYDVSDIDMEPITMIVWVDNKGIITGREFDFSTSEENVSLGSQTSTKGDKTAYKLWATEGDSTSISLTGSHTTKDKLVTGSCKLDINDAMVGPINIKYTNLGVKDFMASGYTGNIAITNPYIVGGSINIDLDYKDKTSFMNLTYNNQDKDLFTLNMSYAKKPFEEVQLPSDDQVYDIDDETDMSNYMAESKVEEYFQYLSDNFSWLDSYISQYKDTIMNSIYGYNDPYDDYDEYDDGYDDYDDEYDDDIESEDTSSVEADYDEIMAAGVPSNGLTTLGVKGADLSASLQSTYFADGFYDTDEYMSNTVSTYDNTEYTYYTTYNSFYYDDTYSNSLQMVSDTVNNDLYSVTFWDNDYDRFESMIMDTLAYVNPSISDSDLEAVRVKLTELYDSGTAGDIELDTIYLSIDKYDTSYYCDISYNNMP